MPLHDWTELPGWDGMHHLWITELLRWVKPRLPEGYRAFVGTAPVLAVGSPSQKPDVSVQRSVGRPPGDEPDEEFAVATLEPSTTLRVEKEGRLIAAVELISPRNKDRVAARASYLARYVGYLMEGVHLLLVDVHHRPLQFSFVDQIAHELQFGASSCPAPCAAGFRVGEPAATGGSLLALWRRPLQVGAELPCMVLPLTTGLAVPINLEETYVRAAADAYLT